MNFAIIIFSRLARCNLWIQEDKVRTSYVCKSNLNLSIFNFADTKMLICFKAQYVYLHEALADALLMMIQHVQTDQFPSVVQHMLEEDKTSAKTRVDEQFQVKIKSQTIYFIVYCEITFYECM